MTRERLVVLLRSRILRGLQSGVLAPGARLPSARTAGADFKADHRLVLGAYRELADEGLVELRERAGVYVALCGNALTPAPGVDWLIDTLLQGMARDVPIVSLHDWIHRAVATRRLRVTVIEGTSDQIAGICRELRDDYGLDASGIDAADLADPDVARLAELSQANLLVTTSAYSELARRLGHQAGVPVIVAEVGPDLLGGDWQTLLRDPLYLIVGDERSVATLQAAFGSVPGAGEQLHIIVVGTDDLANIPDDAAVYVTRGAAAALGTERVGGRRLPTARGLSPQTMREIVSFIVRANLEAIARASDDRSARSKRPQPRLRQRSF